MSDVGTLGPEIGQLLRLAHQRAARTFAAALTPLGIDGRLFGVLSAVARHAPATQATLVTVLDTDKSAILRTVDELEHRGLVERRPLPGDRRARVIALTADGAKCLAGAEEIARGAATEMFGSMSAAELTALRDTLARFVGDRGPA